jgi:hypothetical protein
LDKSPSASTSLLYNIYPHKAPNTELQEGRNEYESKKKKHQVVGKKSLSNERSNEVPLTQDEKIMIIYAESSKIPIRNRQSPI